MVLANVISDFTGWLDEVASNWWFLLVIFGIALLDSVIPIVPSETTVIIGGIAAGLTGDLLFVIGAAALGAFCGDNLAYGIGAHFSERVQRFASSRPKFASRLTWAHVQIRRRGGPLLITVRFIPGGRSALTITSGVTRQPWRWFARWIAVAAVIWATYAAVLGAVAKDRFKDNHTAAFIAAFGAALSVTVVIEVVRHFRERRNPAVIAAATIEEVIEKRPNGSTDADALAE